MYGRDRRNRARCTLGVERLDGRIAPSNFGLSFGFGGSTPAFGYGYTAPSSFSAASFAPATNAFSYTPSFNTSSFGSFGTTPSFNTSSFGNLGYTPSFGSFSTNTSALGSGLSSSMAYSNPFATSSYSFNANPFSTASYGLTFGGNPFASTATTGAYTFGANNPLSNPTMASGNTFEVFR